MRQDRGRVSLKYKTVVIDPPWDLGNTMDLVISHGPYPSLPYDSMSLTEIKHFPINDFIDEGLLFMWVIDSTIREGFDIIEEWGFKYHKLLTWDKGSGAAIWSPIMGRTEHCIFAYRGHFRELTDNKMGVMQSLIQTHKIRKHSEKPARFYQLLRAWTPTPRIDIFARNAHEGFDGWGDEYVGEGPLAPYLKEK